MPGMGEYTLVPQKHSHQNGQQMKLLRLPRSQVKLGQPLPWNVRDEQTRLLLSRGHIVTDEAQLDALLARGAFVDVDEAREALLISGARQQDEGAVRRTQNLFGLWEQSTERMRKLMDKVPDTPELVPRIDEFSRWLIDLIDRDVDISLYHMVRQETQHLYYYGYNHAIHTAVLCLLLTRRLHWPEARTLSLFKAALTMNMAILELQGKMAEQDVPMRESQRLQIQQHPRLAVEWLELAGVTDTQWLGAISDHHERTDGSGYPQGKTEINEAAVALRVADVFIAKISPRKLRAALPIQEAAKQLYREDQGGAMSTAVIKEFGIFPPGDVVKLASGETGVVMRRSANVKCPLVAAITDAKGRPSVHTVQRDTAQAAYAIVGAVTDKSQVARMAPERVYGYASVEAPPAKSEA